jgi:prepilin-type N-terminal cleavage/methylation domain-containing protein
MSMRYASAGFTLLEVLIGLAILTVVSSAVYFSYANVLEIIQAAHYNSAALSIIETEMEITRNMRYEDVGTVGGIPNGILLASRSVALGDSLFDLDTHVRSIDDPYDGTLGGSPDDASPADYKLVQFEVTCTTCSRYRLISMASYVAPKNLENTSEHGALFIQVFDAEGMPVPGVVVHITNPTVIPPVDTTDITDSGGMLQLYDVATSSAGYHIVASKAGYSTDQTYSPSEVANPLHPDATVAAQQLTTTSLAIDRVGTVSLFAHTNQCIGVPAFDMKLQSATLIGTAPDVPKYLQTLATDSGGVIQLSTMEWGTYTSTPLDTNSVIGGRFTPPPFTLAPAGSAAIEWYIAPRIDTALSVAVVGSDDAPIGDALVTLSGSEGSISTRTGLTSLEFTDWSNGAYTSKHAEIDVDTNPGIITLLDHGGTYASGSDFALITETIDLGTASTALQQLLWSPSDQPSETGNDSVRMQIAANTDNATWNFVGPDGTDSSFFTNPNGEQSMPVALLGKRYVRIRIILRTNDVTATPSVEEMTLRFRTGCVPSGTAFFNGLQGGTYTIEVSRPGFLSFSDSISLSEDWQETTITLQPQQ